MVEEKGIPVDRRETIAGASGRDQTEQGHGEGGRKRRERKKVQEDQDSSWKPRGTKQLVIKGVEFEFYRNHKLGEAEVQSPGVERFTVCGGSRG